MRKHVISVANETMKLFHKRVRDPMILHRFQESALENLKQKKKILLNFFKKANIYSSVLNRLCNE